MSSDKYLGGTKYYTPTTQSHQKQMIVIPTGVDELVIDIDLKTCLCVWNCMIP